MTSTARNLLTCAAALGMALQGSVADATVCTFGNEILAADPDFWKKPCRKALRNKTKLLEKIERGKFDEEKAWDYAIAFAAGHLGCTENDDFAFEIAQKAIGWPIGERIQPWKIDFLDYNVPDYLDGEQKRTISWFNWITNPSLFSGLPRGWNEEETRQQISLDGYWELARARFGDFQANPIQDKMLFAASIDPTSTRFDLNDALAMISIQSDVSIERKTQIAELLTEPSLGYLDYDNAARLVAWYSPHGQRTETPKTISKAKLIWTRIAQNMLGSNDPEIHKKGQKILVTGDPYYQKPFALGKVQLPQVPNLQLLNDWPRNLPSAHADVLNRIVTPNDYPARPLRQEQQGAVRLAVLFGPDGNFSDLVILNSSGIEKLDQAAKETVQRRYRPRLKELRLVGHSGKNVLAPLPVIEWRIPSSDTPNPGSKTYRDGRIIVVGQKIKMPFVENYSTCGFPQPSWKN